MFAPRQPLGIRPSLRDLARERLRAEILSGEISPGQQLDDDILALRLGCSRTPVREAINDLMHLGLVEVGTTRYTRVVVPTETDVVPALQSLGLLFGGVVRVTVPSIDDVMRSELFRQLGAVLNAMEQTDRATIGRATVRVYGTFVDACRNPLLTPTLRTAVDGLVFRLRHEHLRRALPWEQVRNGVVALRIAVDCRDGRLAERAVCAIHLLPDPESLIRPEARRRSGRRPTNVDMRPTET